MPQTAVSRATGLPSSVCVVCCASAFIKLASQKAKFNAFKTDESKIKNFKITAKLFNFVSPRSHYGDLRLERASERNCYSQNIAFASHRSWDICPTLTGPFARGSLTS